MKDWIQCSTCESEYKVICHVGEEEAVQYCPFCGSANEEDEWDDLEDEDE